MNTTTHKTIGYLRVSTDHQNVDNARLSILDFANTKNLGTVEFVSEQVSGCKNYRDRLLGQVISELNSGDTIIVQDITRLGRSCVNVLECINQCINKGIAVYSVNGGMSFDNSINSKIITTLLALVADIERSFISERTKTALAARRAAGVQLGRPKGPGKSKLDIFKPEIIALLQNGSTQTFIAKRYGTTGANLFNFLKKNNITVHKAA